MRRLRVWLISPEIHRHGGTERSLVEQLQRWKSRFDLRVYTMFAGDLGDEIPLVNVRRMSGPHLVRFAYWLIGNTVARLRDVRRMSPPDVIVSPGINALDADAIGVHIVFSKYRERVAARLAVERRSLSSASKAFHRSLYARLIATLETHVYRGPALLWAMSQEDARELEARFAHPAGDIPAVPYGVDTVAFAPERRLAIRSEARTAILGSSDCGLALLVGNDLNKKGADFALAALQRLPGDVRLAIAGRSSQQEVAALPAFSGVSERVLVLPHVADPMTYYAAADVLVAPSREDSFHLPAIEAMACGLPVVVSAYAGISEILTPDEDAVVVQNPSDIGELSAAIDRVLTDESLQGRLATHGRALAEQMSWDVNAEKVAALIEREATTPRVLILTTEARGVGGIQRATRTLASSLADTFGDDRVGTLSLRESAAAPIRGRLLWQGSGDEGNRVRVGPKVRFIATAIWTARRWRRRGALIAAHPHVAPVAWACRLVGGVPYAVWCHGIESWSRPRPAVGAALRSADAVFAPSSFTARRVETVAGLQPGTVRVLPHAVPALPEPSDRSGASTAAPPVILSVARLTPANRYKGVDMLLYALPQILRHADVELEIVGDGSDLPRLQRIVDVLRIGDHVRFLGNVEDNELEAAYRRATVFAMPARHRLEPTPEGEGFGLVFVEAGAHGLAVVAGRGAGSDEAVEDRVSGVLADPEDPGAVADAIVRLLRDPALRERLGAGGRRLAETRFSSDAFRAAVVDIVLGMEPRDLVR